jgi:hypothetical protein
MIQLSCTSCKQLLTIDDAFAGGVCRCQHCGTIQTVPANLKNGKGAKSAAVPRPAKTLFQTRTGTSTATGSSLDELADIVASSGLAGSGLSATTGRQPSARAAGERAAAKEPVAVAPPRSNVLLKLIIVGGIVVAALLAAVVYLLITRNPGAGGVAAPVSPQQAPQSTAAPGSPPPPESPAGSPAAASPNFCGIPITENRVVLLIDNGSGTHDPFPDLIEATAKSLRSFGATRQFNMMFWNPQDAPNFPADGFAPADDSHIDAAKAAMSNVNPYGATDIASQLTKAAALSPDVIVIVTGKGWELDSTFTAAATQAIGNAKIKIDAISIGSQGSSAGLAALCKSTGGNYRDVSSTDLSQMAQ